LILGRDPQVPAQAGGGGHGAAWKEGNSGWSDGRELSGGQGSSLSLGDQTEPDWASQKHSNTCRRLLLGIRVVNFCSNLVVKVLQLPIC
jgi:hypothetical protein